MTYAELTGLFLPSILYFAVSQGGLGGAATVAGNAGSSSLVLTRFGTTGYDFVVTSGNGTAGGGGAGTVATGGAGGTAAAAMVPSNATYNNLGVRNSCAGIVGGVGGAQTGAAGASVNWGGNFSSLCPGAGGGGTPIANTDFAGGGIGSGGIITLAIAGGASAAGAGPEGYVVWQPLTSIGGAGGGTAGAAGTAGRGGHAAVGSGGGGGGGGVTGGAGGNGGDGLIVVTWW